jgi:DNA-directed RNA polymerase specialized sigma24 family protein
VARSLRKTQLNGTPYYRREVVEAEIDEIATLSATELVRRASLLQSSASGFMSPEALVYFVRNLPNGAERDKLTEHLLGRVIRRIPRPADAGNHTESLTRMNIRDDVRDRFVDLLMSDRDGYDDRFDYYEINFNSAIASARQDASTRHWAHENRSDELSTDESEISESAEAAAEGYDPFDADELDKKDYRLLLDDAIDTLPEFQRRIVEMLRQEIPIESKDSTVTSISKVMGKAEKTIRTHRDKAFASLRIRLERKGRM